MKATGIYRRVDDLGRIIIPKEVRRSLGIKEGTPLEFFIENGGICLFKYKAYDNSVWDIANKVISPIISKYAIFDCHGDAVKNNGMKLLNIENAETREDLVTKEIKSFNDVVAYIAISKTENEERIKLAVAVLTKLLEEEI